MTRRQKRRTSGPFAPSLNPVDRHRERASCSARLGVDQAGISARRVGAACGSGQTIHIIDEFPLWQRFRQSATLSATLKNNGLIFNRLLRKRNFQSRNAATAATGSRAHMETSFARRSMKAPRMLYARVGRCDCCSVAGILKRYINQILSISDLQHGRFSDRCGRCGTIKYPEISASYLFGGRHG